MTKTKSAKKSAVRKVATSTARKNRRAPHEEEPVADNNASNYPRHVIDRVLRIPQAILDQNAGRECTKKDAANFTGVSHNGRFEVELSSAAKYGLLERPRSGYVKPTELAKQILRPKSQNDELQGLQTAVIQAPVIGALYKHYRGENLPDDQFFDNTAVDNYEVPRDKVSEFRGIFLGSLTTAQLIEHIGDKIRVLDVSNESVTSKGNKGYIQELAKGTSITSDDTCFVMMPFAPPIGDHYSKIYEPAIKEAGLTAIRADSDIFGSGKIIDQIWSGLSQAKVLVAELTGKNPNVFYELGLAHALDKPVVLVSKDQADVPFDLKHIRVIYYDVDDPFWGTKLIAKVAENIVSAIKNPQEAIFKKQSEN